MSVLAHDIVHQIHIAMQRMSDECVMMVVLLLLLRVFTSQLATSRLEAFSQIKYTLNEYSLSVWRSTVVVLSDPVTPVMH